MQHEVLNRFGISIGGGTNEVMRNNLAERALGLPKEPRLRQDHGLEGHPPQLTHPLAARPVGGTGAPDG